MRSKLALFLYNLTLFGKKMSCLLLAIRKNKRDTEALMICFEFSDPEATSFAQSKISFSVTARGPSNSCSLQQWLL